MGLHAMAQKDNVIRNPEVIPVEFLGETMPLDQYVESADANRVSEYYNVLHINDYSLMSIQVVGT
jgi:hypothetical protein